MTKFKLKLVPSTKIWYNKGTQVMTCGSCKVLSKTEQPFDMLVFLLYLL